jgi:hypothetical protein
VKSRCVTPWSSRGYLATLICALAVVLGHTGTAAAEDDTPQTASRDGDHSVPPATNSADRCDTEVDEAVRLQYSVLKALRASQQQSTARSFRPQARNSVVPSLSAQDARSTGPSRVATFFRQPGESAAAAPSEPSAAVPPGPNESRIRGPYVLPPAGSSVQVPPALSTDTVPDTAAETEAETALPPPAHTRLEQVDPRIFGTPIGQIGVNVQPKPAPGLDPEGGLVLPKSLAADFYSRQGTVRYGIMPCRPVASPAPALTTAEFCHLPLYFEDTKLERFGQTIGVLQPVVSGVRFFGTIPLLPYKTVVEPPRGCFTYQQPYEAGRRAPRYRGRYPIRLDAAVVETLAAVGLIVALL